MITMIMSQICDITAAAGLSGHRQKGLCLWHSCKFEPRTIVAQRISCIPA